MNHGLIEWIRVAIACGGVAILSTGLVASEPTTIVAFGDSTTAVRGDLTVYCDLLQTGLPRRGVPVRVINSGVGGNHTGHARERFERDVLAHHPEIVIIQFGINDAAVDVWKTPPADQPRVALNDYKENLRHFVKELRKSDAQVVLMTPNPLRWTPKMREMYGKPPYLPQEENGFNVLLEEYAEAARAIAKAERVPLLDVARAFDSYGEGEGQSVGDLLLDGIHPNAQGHRLIAGALIELIVRDQRAAMPVVKKQAPRMHAEQWENNGKADRITDMTCCEPADALSERRHHDKWKVFEYETEDFSGKCVSVGRESSAPDLTLKLGKQGWHAVYVGLSSITDLVRPAKNQVEVKLTSDSAFTRLSNRLELGTRRSDVLEEVFLGAADLTNNDLQFSTVYEMPARLHYVKTIPLTDAEVARLLADRAQTATKTSVATFDGFTWIHPFRPRNRADLEATFSGYRDSDFKTWWFQVGGADLVHHPSQVGNLMGGHLDSFPRKVDREYVESVRHLHQQGIDPLKVAVEEAHRQQAEILVCLRAAGWKAAPPWEEFFMSEFYEAHPEWRCIDYDGTPTMHLSYAAEEVQDHLIDVYREALQRGADGAGFLFHRGMPMMLWEEPFCQRFMKEFGEDPRHLKEDDPRVFQMRAKIVTEFVRKIRTLLNETSIKRGDVQRRLKLAVSTFSTPADNKRFGLDVERWIDEKLIDQIGIAWFAYYTSGLKTKTGDTAYYARITDGSDVKVFPFYVGWKMESADILQQSVARDYENGADGIAVWDPNQFESWQSGHHPYWPLVSKLGHRERVRDGSLLFQPTAIPLKRLGDNHYSRWYPNTGF
ncbi:MAG: family 10 glycosylhydrolase [Planctomycetales bacterium]|nr:family 10 glycosylhydrolase [Planctomycetales bacterium]